MPVFVLLLWLMVARKKTTKDKLRLRIGAYYLKRGAGVQIGQPIHFRAYKNMPKRLMYIENLYFNFKQNTVTNKMSKQPIKGYSEKFIDEKAG